MPNNVYLSEDIWFIALCVLPLSPHPCSYMYMVYFTMCRGTAAETLLRGTGMGSRTKLTEPRRRLPFDPSVSSRQFEGYNMEDSH